MQINLDEDFVMGVAHKKEVKPAVPARIAQEESPEHGFYT